MRVMKERNRILTEKLRQEESNVRLEEQLRELKGNQKRLSVIAGSPSRRGGASEASKPYHLLRADERIEEQNKIIEMLQRQKERDSKLMHVIKKQCERKVQEVTIENAKMREMLQEKDKEIKQQAVKLRELMHDEFRKETIKKNYSELEKLAQSPQNNSLLDINASRKLDERKSLLQKYSRLPLKPGFNKRKLNYEEKMTILDIQTYGTQSVSMLSASRSRSVMDQRNVSSQKHLRDDQILDNAADQIIEHSLNQYVSERQKEERDKLDQKRDMLDSMYGNMGGKVFDLNIDLNTSQGGMVMFRA